MKDKQEKISYKEAEELYYLLRKIYNSSFYDNKEDKSNAIFCLMDAINEGEVSKEFLIAKMKVLVSKSKDDVKHKLSNLILSKFWL